MRDRFLQFFSGSSVRCWVLVGLVALMVPTTFPVAWAQEYYQWEDEDGQVNFGDAPPNNAKNVRKFGKTKDPSIYNQQESQRVRAQQQKNAADLKKVDGANEAEGAIDTAKELLEKQAELNQAHCQSLRNNLNTLTVGGRVSYVDPETGEKKFLDGAQVQKRIQAARAQIAKECN